MRKWLFGHDTGIINQEFCRKIVSTINNKIIILYEIHDIRKLLNRGCQERFDVLPIDFYVSV